MQATAAASAAAAAAAAMAPTARRSSSGSPSKASSEQPQATEVSSKPGSRGRARTAPSAAAQAAMAAAAASLRPATSQLRQSQQPQGAPAPTSPAASSSDSRTAAQAARLAARQALAASKDPGAASGAAQSAASDDAAQQTKVWPCWVKHACMAGLVSLLRNIVSSHAHISQQGPLSSRISSCSLVTVLCSCAIPPLHAPADVQPLCQNAAQSSGHSRLADLVLSVSSCVRGQSRDRPAKKDRVRPGYGAWQPRRAGAAAPDSRLEAAP